MFGTATQAEIIRSHQKDDYYIRYVKGSLADVVQSLFGARSWIQWRKELDLAADVGYFLLTTASGLQTLGEEYVNIVQTNHTKRKIPSLTRRLFMVILQVGAPYFIDKCLSYCEKQLRQNPNLELNAEGRTRLLELIPVLRHAVVLIHRCHLALFYMRGIFYHIAKRFTGIHYILIRQKNKQEGRQSLRILGWLSLLQLTFTLSKQVYNIFLGHQLKAPAPISEFEFNTSPQSQTEELPSSQRTKCSLCLEVRKHSTATPCGHLFCWDCIHEWCNNKPECPLCRESFQLSRLIALQNYDPV